MLGIGTKQRCGFHLVKGIPTPHMYMYLVHVPNNNKSIKVHTCSICNKYYTKNELIVSITLDVYLMFMRSLTQYEGNTCRTIQFIKICQICRHKAKMWVSFGEGHPNTTHVHVPCTCAKQ
jgi:recombinational DNA repair protein RecR